ncbi:MAG: hypothetical protein HY720_02775 [Planctomycetes bacterium]|nr:hypothetical protein [Planctomycetota bacterium]
MTNENGEFQTGPGDDLARLEEEIVRAGNARCEEIRQRTREMRSFLAESASRRREEAGRMREGLSRFMGRLRQFGSELAAGGRHFRAATSKRLAARPAGARPHP